MKKDITSDKDNIQESNRIGVLFDLDGVLVDSEGEYTVFWGEIGRRWGQPESFAADIKGTTLGQILLAFPEADREGIVEELHQFEARMKYPVYPGVREFLLELRERHIPTAIVTSSDDTKMSFLRRVHPELLDMVDIIVTGSMVEKGKPDPDCYLMGAHLIDRPIEDCYVFEDSMQGLQAGRAAGAHVVGIATTNPAEKVSGLAHLTVPSMAGMTVKRLMEA